MLEQTWLASVDNVIVRIVRIKMRASLRRDDGRENNLDALDLVSEIRVKLLRKQQSDSEGMGDLSAYAATVAYNTCSDYLRSKYPRRTCLKNALRRVIEKSAGYGVWRNSSGETICGYAGWMQTPAATSSQVADLSQRGLPAIDADSPSDLLQAIDHTLNALGAPLALDDLVGSIAARAGIHDMPVIALESGSPDEPDVLSVTASNDPGPEAAWMAVQRMQLVWGAVLQILPWHRAAYLLNLRDGELDAFPYYGVASIEQIGEALALTAEQSARLARGLQVEPPLFVHFWKHLPIEDSLIAEVLAVTRPQVIGYRNKALERLRRLLAGAV